MNLLFSEDSEGFGDSRQISEDSESYQLYCKFCVKFQNRLFTPLWATSKVLSSATTQPGRPRPVSGSARPPPSVSNPHLELACKQPLQAAPAPASSSVPGSYCRLAPTRPLPLVQASACRACLLVTWSLGDCCLFSFAFERTKHLCVVL